MTSTAQDWSSFSMIDLFRMEAESQVAVLNEGLLRLEQQLRTAPLDLAANPSQASDLEGLMRAAHSIKGAARIVQIEAAVALAHELEDCFVAVQTDRLTLAVEHIDVLLKGVDVLASLAQLDDASLSGWLDANEAMIAEQTQAIGAILPQGGCANAQALIDQSTAHPPNATPAQAIQVNSPGDRGAAQTDNPTSEPKTLEHKISEPEVSKPDKIGAVDPLDSSTSHRPTPHDLTDQRAVRIGADNLNQLMALAGEAIIETKWLDPFASSLWQLKRQQQSLNQLLDTLQTHLTNEAVAPNLLEQMAKARQQSGNCYALLSERLDDLDLFSRRFSHLSENLHREVIASHMQPFADGVQSFPRMVRDLAKQLGKQVNFEIIGQATQVDRDILKKLEAPLTHILCNAVTHGIETPAERQAAGKPDTGTLRLEATHRAGRLLITVTDDGCGIEFESLRQRIVDRQLTDPTMAAQLSQAELLEFLFLPGFSTAQQVNEIAGRGVGLDIAKTMVQKVGGLLRAFSHAGQSMIFEFQLPLTLSVVRALLVEIAGEIYAIALSRIDQILKVESGAIATAENRPYVIINDQSISLVRASQVLGLSDQSQPGPQPRSVIVLGEDSYGLMVDQILGERELVVRPLDKRLGKVPNISAAALLETGPPILIMDVDDVVCSIEKLVSGDGFNAATQAAAAPPETRPKKVLVVDDSITVREMERKLLHNHGYRVDVAIDGMEGWNLARTEQYDLVISDIDMPRMNGIELVTEIKAHPQLKSLPVIIVSYKEREADKMAGLRAGADYYLTKSSFHNDRFINAVIDLIGRPQTVSSPPC
ncbi:MAG: hybrid sensor histidine kinase/response regulator [Cyanobacteria bacterium P01_F01_bin.4]